MPAIEERESESDVKEEYERKEKGYQKHIARLEDALSDLQRQESDFQTSIQQANASNGNDQSPEELLRGKDQELIELEEQIKTIEMETLEYQQKK